MQDLRLLKEISSAIVKTVPVEGLHLKFLAQGLPPALRPLYPAGERRFRCSLVIHVRHRKRTPGQPAQTVGIGSRQPPLTFGFMVPPLRALSYFPHAPRFPSRHIQHRRPGRRVKAPLSSGVLLFM